MRRQTGVPAVREALAIVNGMNLDDAVPDYTHIKGVMK
jgi:hypothetical protein